MDRQLYSSLALIALVVLGCSSKDESARPTTVGDSNRHVVERPVDSAPPAASQDPAQQPSVYSPLAEADPAPAPTPSYAAEPPQRTFAPSAEITPVPSPVDQAFNPLRKSFDTPPVTANPLRRIQSAHAAPRMMSEPAPAPLEAPPPAGGAAPPPEGFAEAFSEPKMAAEAPSATFAPQMLAPAPIAGSTMPLSENNPTVPQPPASSSAYDIVRVFYGTDRRAVEPPADNAAARVSRFLPVGCSVLITLCLGMIATARRRMGMWMLVGLGVLVSAGLGYQAGTTTLYAIRNADKQGIQYTSDRGTDGVQLGVCDVSIPKTHQSGELESPSILRLEIREDAARHIVLTSTQRLADDEFYALLKERVAASPRQELFIFVHGFNVSFADAARRTAQIHKDLKFAGAPIFFSWPAHDKFLLTYNADASNVSWSTAHLKQFLLDVTRHSGAKSVNLIAHSMGNRALTTALKELQLELRGESRLFNQVILAAPDIDAAEFRNSIAPAMAATAKRVTLYASSRDEALAASQLVHRAPRAGDAGRGLVVIKDIDTVDVTAIDSSPWGHSYYGSTDPVLQDLAKLLTQAAPPAERTWLTPAEHEGLPYWVFLPAATSTARVPSSGSR